MSRLLVLLPIVLWAEGGVSGDAPFWKLLVFAAGLFVPAGVMAWQVRRATGRPAWQPSLQRVGRMMLAGKLAVLGWFAFGMYELGWAAAVGRLDDLLPLPALLAAVGSVPAYVGWAALWWAYYPAERAEREHVAWWWTGGGMNPRPMPGRGWYVWRRVRAEVLLMAVPVLLALLALNLVTRFAGDVSEAAEAGLQLAAVIVVFACAPPLMVRLLPTTPLPRGSLRTGLEKLAADAGVSCRDILIWRTDHTMANALVMGLLPPMRYVLLSDLLIETLDQRQIEAVFAHEAGHVRHRHLAWFAAGAGLLMLLAIGPGAALEWWLVTTLGYGLGGGLTVALAAGVAIAGIGWLSRRFERQADVFAARLMQRQADGRDVVGGEGATAFVSALKAVCRINLIPLSPFRWHARRPISSLLAWCGHVAASYFHGTMPARIAHILHAAADPRRTRRFDAKMLALRAALLALIAAAGAYTLG